MFYAGIDLHKRDLVIALENESGPVGRPRRFACRDAESIAAHMAAHRPFVAVIEASASYRWLYELLAPLGEVVLAHPLRLRAIVSARAKTDKLDAACLARLLRLGEIPRAYIPPRDYHELRELTRARARLSRGVTEAMVRLHALAAARNLHSPYRKAFGPRGRRWIASVELGVSGDLQRDELLRRIVHFEAERRSLDAALEKMSARFPETAALTDIHGIGAYSALLIVAEIGEPERFGDARQVGAYAGLTARVHQSGSHNYHGHITRQGSSWLRWVLVQAAIKAVRKDPKLRAFYERIRKRSSRHIARVAVARKLAGICWVRLRRWRREQSAA